MSDKIAELEAENQRLKRAVQDLVKLSHETGQYVGSNIPTLDFYDYLSGGIRGRGGRMMAETNECTHGFATYQRRHCVHCTYADEVTCRDAEIKRLKAELDDERSMRDAITCDFEMVESRLDDVVERSLKYKEALYLIRNATMSMFFSIDDMASYMKRNAREALEVCS